MTLRRGESLLLTLGIPVRAPGLLLGGAPAAHAGPADPVSVPRPRHPGPGRDGRPPWSTSASPPASSAATASRSAWARRRSAGRRCSGPRSPPSSSSRSSRSPSSSPSALGLGWQPTAGGIGAAVGRRPAGLGRLRRRRALPRRRAPGRGQPGRRQRPVAAPAARLGDARRPCPSSRAGSRPWPRCCPPPRCPRPCTPPRAGTGRSRLGLGRPRPSGPSAPRPPLRHLPMGVTAGRWELTQVPSMPRRCPPGAWPPRWAPDDPGDRARWRRRTPCPDIRLTPKRRGHRAGAVAARRGRSRRSLRAKASPPTRVVVAVHPDEADLCAGRPRPPGATRATIGQLGAAGRAPARRRR